MNKETKQDVFEEVLDAFDAAVVEQPGALHPTNQLICYADRYAAATPCELPVIPAKLAKMMKAGHEIHADLWTMMNIIANNMTDQDTLDWYFTHGDDFARAWMLGQWEIEEDK